MGRFLVVAALLGSATASATPAQSAATYLQGKQGFDGSFGGATGSDPVLTTALAVQALAPILGSTCTSVQTARTYLSSSRPVPVDLQARRLQALDGTYLADSIATAAFREAAQSASGFGFVGTDSAPALLESAQAIAFLGGDALLTATSAPPPINLQPSAGCSQTSIVCPIIGPVLQFILAAQSASDHGWGFSGESSDLQMTAQITAALMPLRHQLSIDTQLTNAVSFLIAQQASDGHFGSATPSTADTAMAMMALAGAPTAQTAAVNKALSYLTGIQKTDGSWDESELDTALVARALETVLPTLGVTQSTDGTPGSLGLSTDSSSSDSTVIASITINNSGDSTSTATTVVFTAVGDDGQPIETLGTANVGAIDAGSSLTVTDTLSTSGLTGSYHIVATVQTPSTSPQPTPVATAQSEVAAQETVTPTYDLMLTTTDIAFSILDAGGVLDAGVATITATIHENGTVEPTAFKVGFYQGDPTAGGTLIGESSIPWVDAGAIATASMNWVVSHGNGLTPIFVTADPEYIVADINRANNTASSIYQAPVTAVDFGVFSPGITFNPAVVPPGQPVTINASVSNLSAVNAYNVQVGLCPGQSPTFPGCPTQVDTLPVVPAMSTAVATFSLDGTFTELPLSSPATKNLYVTVIADPFRLLSDPNYSNNSASNYVVVANDVSFGITSFAAVNPPSGSVVAGTTVPLQAVVYSNEVTAQHIPWTLYVGDPAFDGVPVASGQAELSSSSTSFKTSALTTGPATLFVLVLDPENTLHNTTPQLARASYAYSGTSTDLGLNFNDISFSPTGPSIGETSSVAVTVHNYGDAGAVSELIAFEGDPGQSGAAQLGAFPVSVAAGSTAQVSFPWTRETAQSTLYFKLVDTLPYDLSSADDAAFRNAYLEAVYTSGRTDGDGNGSPGVSSPAIGDIFGTGKPVIAFGEAPFGVRSGPLGYLTLLQKSATNVLSTVWSKQIDYGVGAPQFVNVDGDAGPRIIFLSVTGAPNPVNANRGNTIHVWTPDAGVVWEKSYVNGPDGGPFDACMNESNLAAPGIGDVNGDGIADVVFPTTSDGMVHVLDGRNGNVIWEKALPSNQGCSNFFMTQPSVLDINGDGHNEVLINGIGTNNGFASNVLVYSSTGTLLSPTGGLFFGGSSSGALGSYAVASPRGPGGIPAALALSYSAEQLQAVVDGGVQVWESPTQGSLYSAYEGPLVAADGMGSGTPLFFMGTQQAGTTIKADGTPGWAAMGLFTPGSSQGWGRAAAAADLLGRGQPQFLAITGLNTLEMFDGPTGAPLFAPDMPESDWGNGDEAFEKYDLAVADVDNDGHGEVVVMNFGDYSDTSLIPYANSYVATASLLVFGSDNHWQPMPTVWSGVDYHHQFNSDLTLASDAYKPWTTHNSWREQFMTRATTLASDLLVTINDAGENDLTWAPSPSDGGSVPAGSATSVTVTVHNIGAVAATSVPVSLYLGNPSDGGTLIAKQTITGTLDAGGGVGSTVFSWAAWPEGWDQLTAVANAPFPDGGRAITESNYANNQYSTTAFVRPGTGLADISVAGANFGTTLGYAAGQPVTLQTTVSNNGTADAGAFTVVFIDGAGGVGPVIGTKQITGLTAGGSTVVQVANWLPAQGVHVVTVEADPSQLIPDSNLGNNTAVITFTIGNATKPDLQITSTDLSLTPAGPVEPGTTVELECLLHSEGTPVSNVPIKVTLDSTTVLLSTTISATLPTGTMLPFTEQVATGALVAGLHTLTVTADPGNVIAEYNETNNSASISFVVGTAPAQVIASTDKSSYGAGAAVIVTAALDGLTTSPTAAVTLDVEIDTSAGDRVTTLADAWSLALGSGVTQTLPFNWNTGVTPPGSYVAFAALTDAVTGVTMSTSKAAFTISATVSDTVTVGPLLNGYQPGATAVVATQIDDQSLNASIANATLVLQINTPASQSFYTSTREFLDLGASNDLKFLDSVAIPYTAAAGNYPMTATLKTQSGTTLAAGTGTLVVQAPSVQNEFGASLTATPPAVAIGGLVTLVASLTNQTAGVLNNEAINVEVANPSTQVVIAQFPSNQNFNAGQNMNINNVWNTGGIAAGTYLAGVLVNGTAVAHAVIQVDAAGGVPPLITITGVTDGELTNQTVTPVINVNCPSGGACNPTATLDSVAFTSGTAVSATGTHFLSVSATDAMNNTSTVSLSFTIYKTAPRITIGGVSNGQYTNAASVTPTVAIADPYLDQTKTVMTLNGTTFYQGMSITAEGSYTLSVAAQDKAGNQATVNVMFVIDRTRPVITITGVTNGEVTNAASVAATITITDLYLNNAATSIKLNGSAYTSGTAITAEGSYSLVVSGADLAGNTASQTVGFSIDRTAPVITITGVANGVTYAGAVQPTITISDSHPKTSTITLDSVAYTSGTVITASGSHTLAVSATDQAGNTSSVSDTFTISPPSAAPFFSPGVCAGTVALSNGAWIAPQLDAGMPLLLNSAGNFSAANTSLVIGSCIAAGNLTFSDTSDLTGTVLLGGSETLTGQAIVGAVVNEPAGYTSPCCAFNITNALTAASTNNDNTRLPAAITSHVVDGGFLIYDGGITFPSGDFYFLSFEVGDGGLVGLSPGAVTQLYVNGPLSVQGTFGGDSTRLGSLTVMASGNISLSAGQSGTSQGGVTIIGEYPVAGLFYSGATVNLSGSTELIGGVVASTLNVSGNAAVVVPLSLTPADAGLVCQ